MHYHTNRYEIGERVRQRKAAARRRTEEAETEEEIQLPTTRRQQTEEYEAPDITEGPRTLISSRRPRADEREAGKSIARSTVRYDKRIPDEQVLWHGDQPYILHRGAPPIQKMTTQAPPDTPRLLGAPKAAARRRRLHGLFYVGLAAMVMVAGWIVFNAIGAWWQNHNDDATYGNPRTFQCNAVVGHGDSADHPSHFIAVNLQGHITIIEIPGGDISKAVIYSGGVLVGEGQDLTPVTLTFEDEPGSTGPAMILHIKDQVITFLNNGQKFVAPANLVMRGGSNPLAWEA